MKLEARIQKGIVAYLRTVLVDCLVYHVPNQGYRPMGEAINLRMMGVLAGVPDIHIVGGLLGLYYIEVKTLDGELRPEQIEFRKFCRSRRIPFGIARSINEARDLIVRWGLETREAA